MNLFSATFLENWKVGRMGISNLPIFQYPQGTMSPRLCETCPNSETHPFNAHFLLLYIFVRASQSFTKLKFVKKRDFGIDMARKVCYGVYVNADL
jgi:hypothetical protein